MALQKLACFHAVSAVQLSDVSFLDNLLLCIYAILSCVNVDFQSKLDLDRFAKGTFHNDFRSKMEYFSQAYRLVIDTADELGVDKTVKQKLKELVYFWIINLQPNLTV